ncbi:hypothetical protein [Rhabdaerophilum sp. SD176]|uniref:hypothetical protein n=1 Tax=Rhabdaerophilum sp. SD176 TaxID=2983548 RepID=UPI0024DF7485|nr:hypothetical protein [Rhabdaerophilum sp. SD176]
MSGSQALFQAALRLYSSQPVREWRSYLSQAVYPFWPRTDAAGIASHDLVERADPAAAAWLWRRHAGEIDIDPGSGQLHRRGKRLVLPAALPHEAPRGLPEVTAYLGGRIIEREPALVLFADADCSFGAFVTRLLPRFFALDALGVHADTLLLVTLNMGRTLAFQHAISDGVFRHRPVELFRPASMIRVTQLDEISVPPLAPAALARMQDRLARLYLQEPPAETGPVLICEDAARRAPALLARLRTARPDLGAGIMVLDPARDPLRDLVRASAQASALVVGGACEMAAIVLAPNPSQEVILSGSANPEADKLARAAGRSLTVL